MKWASAIAGSDYPGERKTGGVKRLIGECAEKLEFQLGGERPDLLIGFVSPHFNSEYPKIPSVVYEKIKPKHFIGCSAGGLIGGGLEVEQEKAIAMTAAVLPDVDINVFHITDLQLPDLDAGPDEWEEIVGVQGSKEPSFVLLPDPFSFQIDSLVQGLDFAFPRSVKLGGLASGASRPGLNALFCDQEVHREGVVGAAIAGNILVDSVVAQGCRPIAKPYRVTKCQGNFLFELDGEPAVHILKEVLDGLSPEDQELARTSLFIGLVMDEFKDDFKAGDFLIRNIVGIEPRTGGLVVGENLRNERRVQFHLRDAATSADDLRMLLKRYIENALSEGSNKAEGALLFSCLGRGRFLYGQPNHDSDCFRQYLGEIPLGGFFCNGEIGPVGGTTFLHGYTSSFGIFRARTPAGD